MNIEYIAPNVLIPYAGNAKEHDAHQVQQIANSIQEFGFRQPIVIDKNNVVVIGHGRLLAAKSIGMSEVPCIRADDLTDTQISALRLADNKLNESAWDFAALETELAALDEADFDMSMFGFDGDIYDDAPEPETEPQDEAPKEKDIGIVKLRFEVNEAAEVNQYINDNGQAGLVMACLNFVRGL